MLDFASIISTILETVITFLASGLLLDILVVIFLFVMGTLGVKKGYWFGLWNLFLSFVAIMITVTFFLDILAGLVPNSISVYLIFPDINLVKTAVMTIVLLGVLTIGTLLFGLLYMIFTPIKGRNYSYRDFDPMVVLKVKTLGFSVGFIEGLMYVLLFNVVLQNLTIYLPEIFPSEIISAVIGGLNPNNSFILGTLNSLFDYSSFFNLV